MTFDVFGIECGCVQCQLIINLREYCLPICITRSHCDNNGYYATFMKSALDANYRALSGKKAWKPPLIDRSIETLIIVTRFLV